MCFNYFRNLCTEYIIFLVLVQEPERFIQPVSVPGRFGERAGLWMYAKQSETIIDPHFMTSAVRRKVHMLFSCSTYHFLLVSADAKRARMRSSHISIWSDKPHKRLE